MIERIRKTIETYHMLEKGDRVVMGVSGGVDSTALLLALWMLREEFSLTLTVVHVNHGIRGEMAKEDSKYVRKLCDTYGISFFLFEEDIPALAKQQGKSEEEMGREYRYRCFYEVMDKVDGNKLAVAHHMEDQAETVLFHLVRGTNISGMRGMLPVNEKLIRPLIDCRKEELEAWLKEEQIAWREDATNGENIYARNRLRNQVFPVLEELNTQAVQHICNLAGEMREQETFLESMVQAYLKEHVTFEEANTAVQTDRNRMLAQSTALTKGVIYEMLAQTAGVKKDLSREHVQAVYDLMHKQSGKKYALPYQLEAQISYEKLIIRKCLDIGDEEWEHPIDLSVLVADKRKGKPVKNWINLPFSGILCVEILSAAEDSDRVEQIKKMAGKNCKNNYAKFFDCDKIKDTVYIRTPRQGDYFVMNRQGERKSLSHYFKDVKMPADKRKSRLVVAAGQAVLWVLGGRRCEDYKVQSNTEYILMLTYEGENNGLSY